VALIDLTPGKVVRRCTLEVGRAGHAEASLVSLRSGALFLTDVYVPPKLRGQGLARYVILAVLASAGGMKGRLVLTYAAPHGRGKMNPTTLHEFYLRLGFKPFGGHPDAGPLQRLLVYGP